MSGTNPLGMNEAEVVALFNGEQPAQAPEPQSPENNQPANNQPQNSDAPAPAEPAKPDAPAQQPSPANVNIDEELLKISGGALKSKEDLATLLEKSNSIAEFETKLKTYQDENTALKAQANTEVFASPFLKGLNELYKANASETQIKAYETLNRINLEELSPLDVRKLALQSQHGLTAEKAEIFLKDQYKLDPEKYDEATITTANIKLEVDSKADLEYLKSQKADSAIPPTVKAEEEAQAQQAQHIEKLKPIATNILNELSFKGISINGKQGTENITADFDISDESKKVLNAQVEGYLQTYGANIPANEDGVKMIRDFAQNVVVLSNWKNWLINAASNRETQVRAEYHNPSGINRGENNPNRGKTSTEEMGDWILQNSR